MPWGLPESLWLAVTGGEERVVDDFGVAVRAEDYSEGLMGNLEAVNAPLRRVHLKGNSY